MRIPQFIITKRPKEKSLKCVLDLQTSNTTTISDKKSWIEYVCLGLWLRIDNFFRWFPFKVSFGLFVFYPVSFCYSLCAHRKTRVNLLSHWRFKSICFSCWHFNSFTLTRYGCGKNYVLLHQSRYFIRFNTFRMCGRHSMRNFLFTPFFALSVSLTPRLSLLFLFDQFSSHSVVQALKCAIWFHCYIAIA